jgi:hypothetical protein
MLAIPFSNVAGLAKLSENMSDLFVYVVIGIAD